MKKKMVFTFFAILILNILPLVFNSGLILHFKTIILACAAAVLWLSQPSFSAKAARDDYRSDKNSIVIILICSCLCVSLSVVEWGYFTEEKGLFDRVTIIGAIMLVAGIILRVWSIHILGKQFTATVKVIDKHQLIKTGPYKYVRHPSYLGALIAITGCPLFLNNFFSVFFCFFAMMIAYYFRIKVEEKTLSHRFGLTYERYKKDTYKLLPLIW